MLLGSAKPSKNSFLLNAFPKYIIFRPQPMDLLMLCFIINFPVARTRQMQLQMLCFVRFQEKLLEPHVSEPCSYVYEHSSLGFTFFEFYIFKPCFHVFEPYALKPYVSEPCFHVFKPCFHVFELCTLKLHISKPRFYVSNSRSHAFKPCASKLLFRFHSFKPHFVGFLHFFNSTKSLLAEHLSSFSNISCEDAFQSKLVSRSTKIMLVAWS